MDKIIVQAHDAATVKYDEAMNVKLLLREICQFLDTGRDPGYTDSGREQLKNLASKVTEGTGASCKLPILGFVCSLTKQLLCGLFSNLRPPSRTIGVL